MTKMEWASKAVADVGFSKTDDFVMRTYCSLRRLGRTSKNALWIAKSLKDDLPRIVKKIAEKYPTGTDHDFGKAFMVDIPLMIDPIEFLPITLPPIVLLFVWHDNQWNPNVVPLMQP